MARNCPSYKTMYQDSQREVSRLRREVKNLEEDLEEAMEDQEPSARKPDEDITIHAKMKELGPRDPFLDLEGRAILIVHL